MVPPVTLWAQTDNSSTGSSTGNTLATPLATPLAACIWIRTSFRGSICEFSSLARSLPSSFSLSLFLRLTPERCRLSKGALFVFDMWRQALAVMLLSCSGLRSESMMSSIDRSVVGSAARHPVRNVLGLRCDVLCRTGCVHYLDPTMSTDPLSLSVTHPPTSTLAAHSLSLSLALSMLLRHPAARYPLAAAAAAAEHCCCHRCCCCPCLLLPPPLPSAITACRGVP